MTIMVTGHRQLVPAGHTGSPWPGSNPAVALHHSNIQTILESYIVSAYSRGHIDFISGMAIGADQLYASAVLNVREQYGLPVRLIAAVPFNGQEGKWPALSKNFYAELISRADQVVVVSQGGYSPAKMQIRNEWMVDNSDHVLAIWDGKQSGGTFNCVSYALSKGKSVQQFHPGTLIFPL